MTVKRPLLIITGTRKGIGRYLSEYYIKHGYFVVGCSRSPSDLNSDYYEHYTLDVSNEKEVVKMVRAVKKKHKKIFGLINNAGVASMNHVILTPLSTVKRIFSTNFYGTFNFCREVAKVMIQQNHGRIINMVTVATPMKLDGEAIYAASKSAVENFTQILAKELARFKVTCNAVGPTPVETDLIKSVPQEKIDRLLNLQTIKRLGTFKDISNVIDFFLNPKSNFITGQVIYLGGL